VVIPVAAELFGYAVQLRDRLFPDTTRVSVAVESSSTVIPLCVALKGPTEVAGSGIFRVRPLLGTGLGMATLKDKVGVALDAGVAPTTSSFAVAEPLIDVLPRAAAAWARVAGRFTVVW
jgi:hypothetical protein